MKALARTGRIEAHRVNQTIWAMVNAAIGVLTVIAGLWLVLQMNDVLLKRLHVAWWKNLMRATLAGYWLVALLGITTYYFWYAG